MDDVVKVDQIDEKKDIDVNTMSVSRKERTAFYLASLFRDMSYAIVGGFLLLFYIDIMGFLGTAALIFIPIISRIWDGVNDPLVGAYFDRRPYTNEKARPIFKSTFLICAIMLILMFYAPTFSQNETIDYILKSIYAIFTYGIFEGFHTLNGTAFMTLYNSISANPYERTQIISRARLFSTIGTYSVYGAIPVALGMIRNDEVVAKTYIYLGAAILISICFVIYNFLMYRYVRERVITPSQEKQKILPMLKKLVKNKLLIIMIISTSLANLLNIGAIQLYFFTYNMGNPALQTILVGITMPTFFMGSLITPALVKKFNKRELYIASTLVVVVVNLLYLLGGYKPSIWVVLIVFSLMNFALGLKGVLYWNMVSDTVDYGEWKTHVRNDGLVYAIEGFALKIIGSVGGMYVGIVITIINFVPNALKQTEATMQGLFYIPIITIIIMTFLSIIPIFFYDLDEKKHAIILEELKERKELIQQ